MKELAPWSAVLMLLQLFIGELVDAARQCSWQWISGHDPSCGATPILGSQESMEKQHPETLHCFLLSPIVCGNGAPASHWWLRLGSNCLPQDKASGQMPLFPGYCADGHKRCWAGTNPYQHVLTWVKFMKLQEASHKARQQHQPLG